jgi:hypothetical protein
MWVAQSRHAVKTLATHTDPSLSLGLGLGLSLGLSLNVDLGLGRVENIDKDYDAGLWHRAHPPARLFRTGKVAVLIKQQNVSALSKARSRRRQAGE